MKKFLCDSQYGFRKQYSTQHVILDIIINEIPDNNLLTKKMYSCDKKRLIMIFFWANHIITLSEE